MVRSSRYGDVGVQVEAVEARLAGTARGHPRGIGLTAELQHSPARTRAHGDAPLHRRRGECGEGQRHLGERVAGSVASVVVDATPLKESAYAPHDRREEPGDLLVGRRGRR